MGSSSISLSEGYQNGIISFWLKQQDNPNENNLHGGNLSN